MVETTVKERRSGELAGNLDTSFLKVLALCFMFIDHLGAAVLPRVGELRMIGRMALPLYAWCLVVGSVKTHNAPRYALRLLGLAVLSQPLYMMALNHTWTDLNILFLLFIAQVALQGIRARFMGSQIWVPALCYVLLGFVQVDYGWRGLTFILILYMARGSRGGLAAAYLAYALFWGSTSSQVNSLFGYPLTFLTWDGLGPVLAAFFRLQGMIWLSLPLILCPTRTGLRLPGRLGYWLYPIHLVVLILIRLMTGTGFDVLVRGF